MKPTQKKVTSSHLIIGKERPNFINRSSILFLFKDVLTYLSNRKKQFIMKNLLITFGLLVFILISIKEGNAQHFWQNTPIEADPFGGQFCNYDDWTALKAIYESTNGNNWRNRDGWKDIIANHNVPPQDCSLQKLYGVTLNGAGRVVKIDLNAGNMLWTDQLEVDSDIKQISGLGNNLRGNIPVELDLLAYLQFLDLGANYISGNIPNTLNNLTILDTLVLNNNDLTGDIPAFNNLSYLNIASNRFTVQEIEIIMHFTNINTIYSPQYFAHNYPSFTANPNQTNNFTVDFGHLVSNNNNIGYHWQRNNDLYSLSAMLNLTNISIEHTGIYTFHINYQSLLTISKPIYVIYPGYDFEGSPVLTNQLMVEFDNANDTYFFENQILFPNAGFVADQCNCNRELYLWEFPNDEDLAQAILEIDIAKTLTTIDDDEDGEIDGGFNNIVVLNDDMTLSSGGNTVPTVFNNNENYTDAVDIFVLDTGLDNSNCIDNNNLRTLASTDTCFDTANLDDNGHGTIGYNLISEGLSDTSNIKISLVKTFNNNGQGNLYKLVCGMYYSIDNNADIINISAGYYGEESSILTNTINVAIEQDIFICTAAGNDNTNIDLIAQYPAKYAGMYYKNYNEYGELIDSIKYKNVISIAALTQNNQLANFSNYGQQTVTMACNGENLATNGIACNNYVASGTSFATFIVSRFLALEIAQNNNRNFHQIWSAFENDKLVLQNNLINTTITGKSLNVGITGNSNKVGSNLNKSVLKNSSTLQSFTPFADEHYINANLYNTLSDNAYLHIESIKSGLVKIDLFDVNGRFINTLEEKYVNIREMVKVSLSKNELKTGIYFLNVNFQSHNGEKSFKIIQFPVF